MPATFKSPPIFFGCWGLGGGGRENPAYGEFSEQEAYELIDSILECGVTHFDTSPAYGGGLSESRLGAAVAAIGCREKLFLATKFGYENNFKKVEYSEKNLLNSLHQSFKRLGTKFIDLCLFHSPVEKDFDDMNKLKNLMSSLKNEGVVRNWGVSVANPYDIDKIHPEFSLDYVQVNFNLLDQRLFNVNSINRMKLNKTRFLARTVFHSGFLIDSNLYKKEIGSRDHRSKYDDYKKYQLCLFGRYMTRRINGSFEGLSKSQICINFVNSTGIFDGIVIGSLSRREWAENLQSQECRSLTPIEVDELYRRYKIVESQR